jgi:hypothetical protein
LPASAKGITTKNTNAHEGCGKIAVYFASFKIPL